LSGNELRKLKAAIAASKALTERLIAVLPLEEQPILAAREGEEVMAWWNELVADLPLSACKMWTAKRDAHYRNRLSSGDWNETAIEDRIRHLKPFVFDGTWLGLDWLLKSPDNLAKMLEGKYSYDAEREELLKAQAPVVEKKHELTVDDIEDEAEDVL